MEKTITINKKSSFKNVEGKSFTETQDNNQIEITFCQVLKAMALQHEADVPVMMGAALFDFSMDLRDLSKETVDVSESTILKVMSRAYKTLSLEAFMQLYFCVFGSDRSYMQKIQ